jgi:hypothetical protein
MPTAGSRSHSWLASPRVLIVACLFVLTMAGVLTAMAHQQRTAAAANLSVVSSPSNPSSSPGSSPHQCSGKGGECTDSGSSKLLPVNDAMHNVREMVKQLLLLEDHMFQQEKQCRMCIAKHMFTIEALAEEGVTLCGGDTASGAEVAQAGQAHISELMNEAAKKMRELHDAFKHASSPEDVSELGQVVRNLRRQLMVITEQ